MNKNVVKEYVLITAGVILVALAMEYFFIPNNIAAGGVTGLAIVITNYIPALTPGPIVLIIEMFLYVVAIIFIGGKFGGKTIYASLCMSSTMWIIEKFFNPFSLTNDLIIATIFGTLLSAVGISIVFNANASTGGTDIIAKILNKFFHIDIGKALLGVDFIVTLLGALTFGLDIGLYALLAVIINGFAIDSVIAGMNVCKEVMIISKENEKISGFILEKLERGCTFLNGVGGYSKEEVNVLYTVVSRREFIKLKQYIASIDKKAFITIGEVHEVMGEGFKDFDEI